jgi:hypothetical protein
MLTFSLSSPMPIGVIVAQHQAWLAALGQAVISALAVLMLGDDDLDPGIGLRI